MSQLKFKKGDIVEVVKVGLSHASEVNFGTVFEVYESTIHSNFWSTLRWLSCYRTRVFNNPRLTIIQGTNVTGVTS